MLFKSSIYPLRFYYPYGINLLLRKNTFYLQHNFYANDACPQLKKDETDDNILPSKTILNFFVKPRINFRAILEQASLYEDSIKARVNKECGNDPNTINSTQFQELLDNIPLYFQLKKACEKIPRKDKVVSEISCDIDLKKNFKIIENKINQLAFKLPNILNDKLFYEIKDDFDMTSLETGALFEYHINQTNYIYNKDVLMDNFETENIISDYFTNILKTEHLEQSYYNMLTGPDFIRNEISNICDIPHNKGGKDEMFFCVGSLPSYDEKSINLPFKSSNLILSPSPIYTHLASFIKSAIVCDNFPLAFYNISNIYQNIHTTNLAHDSITYSPYQTRIASIFNLAANSEESRNAFLEMYNHIISFYASLNISIFSKICKPWELERAESFRINFYLKHPSTSKYIKCGYIADIGDYLSQRLAIMGKVANQDKIENTGNKPSSYFFLHCIHGQIANIPLITLALSNKL